MEIAGGVVNSAVVLIDGAGGREMHAVREALTAAWRLPVLLLGPADLRGAGLDGGGLNGAGLNGGGLNGGGLNGGGVDAGGLSFDATAGVLTAGGRRVRPAVVWTRHCAPATLVAHASVAAPVADAWAELIAALTAAAPITLPGPAPRPAAQLAQARRLGIRVPRTVLTTDPAAAARALATARVVIKHPDFRLTLPDPAEWGPYLPVVTATPPADSPGRPVTVQEYVEHDHELRVYYLDGTLCAFRVDKPHPAALWTDPDTVTVTPAGCPSGAAAVVRRLATAWGLRYAAFDLLVTRAGETVFLEANADGDWLYFASRAGRHGVSILAAAMVRELFGRVTTGDRADERAAA